MKKKDQFKPVSNIDDIYKAVEIASLKPGDSRYTDCAKMRGSNTIKTIERNLKST
jgi:hypothetical protein